MAESRTVFLLGEDRDRVIEIGLNRIAAQRKYYEKNRERLIRNLREWRKRRKGKP